MKQLVLLIIAGLLIVSVSSASAGSRAMRKEFEDFTPGSFYQDNISPPESAMPPPVPEMNLQPPLASTYAGWQEKLATRDGVTSFFTPDPLALARLHDTADDQDKAFAALKDRITLNDLEIITFLRNPAIKAANSRLRGTVETYSQVSQLDDILRRYTAFTEALMPGVGPMKGTPAASTFPFPGITALKGQVVDGEVEMAAQQADMTVRTILTMARTLFWNLKFNLESQRVTSRMLDNLKRLESVATTRYEAGQASFQDVIQIRINREKITETLVTIRETGKNLTSRILEITNLPPSVVIAAPVLVADGIIGPLPEIDLLYRLALDRNQEIATMRAKVGRMEAMIEMAETMIVPQMASDLSRFDNRNVLTAGSGAKRDTFSVSTEASRGAGLPKMPWFGTNDAYLNRSRQELAGARQELQKTENSVIAKVREAWFNLDRANRETALYNGTIVGLSQAGLEVTTQGYESGQVGFAPVIDTYNTWLDSFMTLERKKSDIGIGAAQLQEAIGGPYQDAR